MKFKKLIYAILTIALAGSNVGGYLSVSATKASESISGTGRALIPFDKVWDDEINPKDRPSSIRLSLYKYIGNFNINSATLVETVNVTAPTWHYDFDISNQALQNFSGMDYKYKIIETPVEGYIESVHVDPTVRFIPPEGADSWRKYPPCNELNIGNSTSDKNPILALGKGHRMVIWSETALTPAEREAIRGSLQGQPGVGSPRYYYINGYGKFSEYGLEVTSELVKFSSSNDWSLIFFGRYVPTASNITAATITNKYDVEVAKSFTIEKTFSGVSAEALKNLSFTITGPKDFGTNGKMTIGFDDCNVSGNKAICAIDATIYVGEYTVKENNADLKYFTLTTTGDNITKTVRNGDEVVFKIDNQYVVDKTTYTVTKIWNDDHDRDGKRPEALTIELLADDEVIKTQELSSLDVATESEPLVGFDSEDVWTYTFMDLPIANKAAQKINYSANEILDTEDYEKTEETSDEGLTTFVNTHIPELVNGTGEITVTKIWEDNNNGFGVRPNGVRVTLFAGDDEIASAIIRENENGEWVYVFDGLYKYRDGALIKYSVKEDTFGGDYRAEMIGNVEEGFMITNSIVDPCAYNEGCGSGNVLSSAITTPNTGALVRKNKEGVAYNTSLNSLIGGSMLIVFSLIGLGFEKFGKRLTNS